jgi:hypothetical protein
MAGGGAREAVVVTIRVLPIDPGTYQRHALHAESCVWVEKNCYIDIWIEVLHALGLDPMAMLGFVLAIDFEDDQWTFFKPVHAELRELYDVDVEELNVWRPIVEHAQTQLAAGKLVSTEADAFWLPDTAGTDYRTQHTKTTIVINELDAGARRLGYFHNASYHALEGEDFVQLFRIGAPADPAFMPLFAEIIKIDRRTVTPPAELAAYALVETYAHWVRRPTTNPVERFAARVTAELPEIAARGLPYYHAWAFATVRQLGAGFELAAAHLRWLATHASHQAATFEPAAAAFDKINHGATALGLTAARAVNAKKPLDVAPLVEMAADWQRGMDALAAMEPA